jgi:GDP-mannose 6-dehydrogenase
VEAAVKIMVIGLGYVGTVAGACLADTGHDVTFVDVNPLKIDQLNTGSSPVAERGLQALVEVNSARGRLRATDDLEGTLVGSDATLVCVGTPTGPTGDVRLDDLEHVAGQIGRGLAARDAWHLVLVTSTVPPGTTEDVFIPLLEKESAKVCGLDFGVAFSPEFLREGSAVADFCNPPRTVVGASDDRALEAALAVLDPFAGATFTTSIRVAETAKFADNAWHALKVAFANEIGRFCDAQAIDSQAVMDVFRRDTRLNLSGAYLNPGFAFGGSCLPKDLRTLNYRARSLGVELPVLGNVLVSNRAHLELAMAQIERYGVRRVALLGITFKAGTDDLRESPMLDLAERLIGKGYTVTIHDEHLEVARLVGANREYVLRSLPHIASLLCDDLDEVVAGAELIVIAHGAPAYADVPERVADTQHVLDLAGTTRPRERRANYRGLVW